MSFKDDFFDRYDRLVVRLSDTTREHGELLNTMGSYTPQRMAALEQDKRTLQAELSAANARIAKLEAK